MMEQRHITVLVVDDNPMMRSGLKNCIDIRPDLEVIGEAANGEEALSLVRQHQPDVITMDYQMPGDTGLVVTEKILDEFPEANIILITVFDSEEDVMNAVRAGVKGYLTKKASDVKELQDAVYTVAEGGSYFPESISRKLEERRKKPDLTSREMEILKLLADGHTNKSMAVELGVSTETVKRHLANLREKLGAVDRTQAVVFAYKKGILHVEE